MAAGKRVYVSWSKPGEALDNIKVEVWACTVPSIVTQCDHLALIDRVAVGYMGRVVC